MNKKFIISSLAAFSLLSGGAIPKVVQADELESAVITPFSGTVTYYYTTSIRTNAYPPSSLYYESVTYRGSLYRGYVYRQSVIQDPDTGQYFATYAGTLNRYQY